MKNSIYIPPTIPFTSDVLDENSNIILFCSTTEVGLRNAKLGIEGTGEENSIHVEPPELRNENPPEADKGVTGSTKIEENDDLHVNVGD